ncbi:MAG: GNAT family N-acetyltransferase [Candidatus Atabeyarchaeum deiterrae]
MKLLFRTFENKDAKAVVDLFNTCFEAYRTLEEWIWMYLRMPGFDPSGILLAEDQGTGQIVGSLVLSEGEISVNGRRQVVGWIDDVSTSPNWRGRGIAGHLMSMAISESNKRGYSAMFLYANPSGRGARIYRRLGFKDVHYSYIHGKSGRLRSAIRNLPLPMNIAAPIMVVVSGISSRRCRLAKSQARTRKLDCSDKTECEHYLDAMNDSLQRIPLFHPYSRESWNWLIRDAPNSISPAARYIEKSGRIICGAEASVFRMRFFGRTFNTWVINDLFASNDLQSPQKETYVRSVIEDLTQDGEMRDCSWHMALASQFDTAIVKSLRPCGYFSFISATFMCLPLRHEFSLPPFEDPWYCWKQHMIGVP